MFRIAITGGIACGKSAVGSLLRARDVPVCDTDRLAHDAMARGTVAYDGLVSVFGGDILGSDGEVDRSVLGRMVFSDSALLEKLNSVLHPVVMSQCAAWMDAQASSCRVVAAEVPLLYEAGYDRGWDAVVCVWAPMVMQTARLVGRGLSRQEMQERLDAQWSGNKKALRSDYVLLNVGSLGLLDEQVDLMLQSIVGDSR